MDSPTTKTKSKGISSKDIENEDHVFDWNRYLMTKDAEEVPDDFFCHVCKSEQNGIDIGSVVEVENEDLSGYWFASVNSSNGVLLNLHYLGDDHDKHDFWLEVRSSRIHSLNWGSENNKKLIPPYPDTFFRVNPDIIKEKVQDCEHVVSNDVLKMGGAAIYNIFKPDMLVEVQDKEYPYRVWVTKIIKNVGGRLFLIMEGASCPEKIPFWLFYMNDRIFPLGWAEQKGLPWRVMNSKLNLEDIKNSSSLLNVLKPKTPGQHTFKVGEMLEVINPYSLLVFYVGTIVKIYDNRYFKVEVDNDSDVQNRITFVATKENPCLFEPGWARKHNCVLKPPSDWTSSKLFSWSEYASMKNSKLAIVDNVCKRKIDNVRINMKLEAADPVHPGRIRVATIKGFSDHWMFLSFDRTNVSQEFLHVRSVYSDEIFPAGWCSKHKYFLTGPSVPYQSCPDFDHCFYISDNDVDFGTFSDENVLDYPNYFKGDIHYYFKKRNSLETSEDSVEESTEDIILNDNRSENFDASTVNACVKTESPELDEEFHDALFLEGETNAKNNVNVENEDGFVAVEKEIEKQNLSTLPKISFYADDDYKVSIYFNKNCRPGRHITRKKISELPDSIGPGFVLDILQKGLTLLVNSNYFPVTSLKKVGRNQHALLDGPGGISVIIHAKIAKSRSTYSEFITLPETKKMAHTYCVALSKFYGMCEYFMTTKNTPCSHGCNTKENACSKLKSKVNVSQSVTTNKRKHDSNDDDDGHVYKKNLTISNTINKVASKLKSKEDISKSMITNRRKHNYVDDDDDDNDDDNDDNNLYEKPLTISNKVTKVDSNLKSRVEVGKNMITNQRKNDSDDDDDDDSDDDDDNNDDHDDDDHLYGEHAIFDKIDKVAKKHLNWKNSALVKRYKYYLAFTIQYESYIKEISQCSSPEAIALIEAIHMKKHRLRIMDTIDDYQNTKSEFRNLIDKVLDNDDKTFVFTIDWKNSMENYYRNDLRFKTTEIDIGHFEQIVITSNPKYWSPDDVFKYLSSDVCCSEVAKTMNNEEVDGIAFMILTEDQLLNHLKCPLNLAVRIMCHVAEAKYVCFTEYIDA